MLKNCQICGKPFDAQGTAKYCCEACQREGERRTRRAWAERTGFNEKRRNETQEYNNAQLEAAKTAADQDEKREERNRKRRENYRQKQQAARLQEAADAGDALAKMRLAEPHSMEYWDAYAQYEIERAAILGKPISRTVNGISVLDEEFSLKVVISIEEQGGIITAL